MKEKVLSGTLWNTVSLFITKGIQILVQLLLTRLLSPKDYGLVGMAVVFTSIVTVLSELGVASSLVRRTEKEIEDIALDTAFFSSIAFNLIVYFLVAFAVAPFAAWFYEEPELIKILPVIGLNMVLQTASLIPRVILIRQLNFKTLNLIQFLPLMLAGITAVVMAFNGFGVWSLIANSLMATFLSIPFFWAKTSWRPRFRFSAAELKEILSFGIFDSLQSGLVTMTKNADYLLIGRFVNSNAVGYYNLAFVLTDSFRQNIMGIFNGVMFPVYSKLQSDNNAVKDYYLLIVKICSGIVTGIMLVFICFAENIIRLCFGPEWLPATFPLQMLAGASIVHALGGTSSALLRGLGLAKLDFKLSSYNTFAITLPCFVALTYFYGINGTAVAVVIQKASERIFYQYYLNKIIGVRIRDIAKSILPVLLASAGALLCYYFLVEDVRDSSLILLIAHSAAVFIVYGIIIGLLCKDLLIKLYQSKSHAFK